MKIYLVGGAVRDQLLGYPIQERDWVVTGATADELCSLGYQQVGKNFPVFLHPQTREEYALARTERKTAPGYYGFSCDFSSDITLEEDLQRRDLTINAMAMDDHQQLIDPFHGLRDLKAKILRHVSDAFVEDPVRILRVARFAARYHHLGFRLADSTRALMYRMVKAGELDHLVPERVWQEWFRSLSEQHPEVFFSTLRSCDALKVIFPEIDALFGVPQTVRYHPEIDTGIHTMMVLQQAVKLSQDPKLRFGALLHDLGKGTTPMALWPKHHGHEERGVEVIKQLCQRLRVPADYRAFAINVSRYHLLIHRGLELKAATLVKVLEKIDAWRNPQGFEQLLQAAEADAKGRLGLENLDYHQPAFWKNIYQICVKIKASHMIEAGCQGAAIKTALHAARVRAVSSFLKTQRGVHETGS